MSLKEYEELLCGLPLSAVDYAFAYGSGALQQKGENKSDKMVDFILSTSDPVRFHEENLKMNPSHYSLFRCVGANALAKYQTRLAARIYYNTHVRVGSRRMKYGVIATDDLNRDLLDWKWLYVAGRLHKPVLDVRKIVRGSMEELNEVYEPILSDDPKVVVQNGNVLQDGSTAAIYHRLNLLPSTVLNAIQRNWNKRNKWQKDTEEVLFSLAHRHDVSSHLSVAISSIVAPVAISQSLKNTVSAGFSRSVLYGLEKLTKMVRSMAR
ncbi:hypothetical protein Aduo_002283 [Ancylostoma duodenale]